MKDQFKHLVDPFAINVNPGESSCLVLKKIEGYINHAWPPQGIKIFKKK